MREFNDPIERIVADALRAAGIEFTAPFDGPDFQLTGIGVAIECKQFFTMRIVKQMQASPDIIVIQGVKAAETFAAILEKAGASKP